MAYPGLVPTGGQPGDVRSLIAAFENFRKGILYFFIAAIVLAFSMVGMIGGLATGAFSIGAGFLVIAVIGLAIGIVGLLKLKESGEQFARFDPNLSKLKTAVNLYIASFIIMILGFLIAYASPFTGLGIVMLAGLLSLVAAIFFGLHLMSLGDLATKGLPVPEGFRLDGILYLVGIIISILQLIAIILAYIHAGEAIQRLSTYRPEAGGQQGTSF